MTAMDRRLLGTVLALALVMVACTGAAGPAGSGGEASGAPSGSAAGSSGALSEAQLRYRLMDQLGRLVYCDPDIYPVARVDVQALAIQRLAQIAADRATYAAITSHLGYPTAASLAPDQALAVYTDWKMLNALRLTPAAGGAYGFEYVAAKPSGSLPDTRVTGTIDAAGLITATSQTPSPPPPCPICLARGTRIAAPGGDVPVEDLALGAIVWTRAADGARVAAPVILLGSTPVPASHRVVHLVLSDGRVLDASPGHRLADGRALGDLRPGDVVDGSTVRSAELEPYTGGATFDLLPAGATGTYWADGVPLASTIGP